MTDSVEARRARVEGLGPPPRLALLWRLSSASDAVWRGLLVVFGLTIPLLLVGIAAALVYGAWPAVRAFGGGFLTGSAWDPVSDRFGGVPFLVGTLASSLLAILIGLALFLTELAPRWLAAPIAFATELLAAIPSVVYGLWAIFVLVPFLRGTV